jgi:hypothetical protein
VVTKLSWDRDYSGVGQKLTSELIRSRVAAAGAKVCWVPTLGLISHQGDHTDRWDGLVVLCEGS